MSEPQSNIIRTQAYIGGVWTDAASGKRFPVYDPASNDHIADVADLDLDEVRHAIAVAQGAQKSWQAVPAKTRAALLKDLYALLKEHREELAELVTRECGKPIREALGEIDYGASFIEWFAEEAKRVYGELIPTPAADRRILVVHQPVGVCGLITPWNFPNAMITRKIGPALAAGCTVVLKPADETPLSALAIAALAEKAGFPPGVINVVTSSNAPSVGAEFCRNPTVRKISFTGSTAVGRILMRDSAEHIKKLSLELGGNAPFIVFDDANLDKAVAAAIASKYRNTGQTCVCTNRFLVQDGIYDAFASKLSEAVGQLNVGHGLDGTTEQGPIINTRSLRKVQSHIDDAVQKGARVLTGGKPHALGGTFYEPTVLADVNTHMSITREETFGPVAPLFRFTTEEEAIAMANDTEFGLASYLFTENIHRIWRVSEALEYGMVGINEGIISTEVAPFGGIKASGLGREGSHHGIKDYTEIKYLCMGGLEESN